ncbi:MFS general substrate transporter [Serendipita vermifera]|nr:MFS general substrate transporter [Serendipita vermifera]
MSATVTTTITESYSIPNHAAIGGVSTIPSGVNVHNKNRHIQEVSVESPSRPHLVESTSSNRGDQVHPGSSSRRNESGGVSAIAPEMRNREKWVLGAMCVTLFLTGWSDGTLGPLLPRIQDVYDVNFVVISLLFISSCIGFVTGSVLNIWLTDKFNLGVLMIAGSICQIITFAVQAIAPPFPVFCIFFVLNGAGISIQDAQANGLVASLHEHASEKMGLLHAIYALGAFASPLVSTQFAQQSRWSFHFLVSLGLAILNTIFLSATVKGNSLEDILRSIGSPPIEVHPSSVVELTDRPRSPTTQSTAENGNNSQGAIIREQNSMSRIVRSRVVQLMALFVLVYVGIEVTISGWIVTYLIDVRGGGPSSGYVSSGFFGGLMVGSVALLWVNKKMGERQVIFIYIGLAIGLELVIWLVPSFIGNAVTVSLIGLLLGPVYPLCISHTGRVLPRKILTGSIGWIAGFGQAGSAILPFMTGALANKYGIKSLQPLLVAMMGFMTLLWALVPGHSKRRD